jgi:glycerol 3-phosphatase-2
MSLFARRSRSVATPLDGVDAVLADLDGVVYQGPNAIPFAVDSLTRVAADGIRIGYITNNASRTDLQVAEHLSSFGLEVAAADVVTSPQAAVRLLAELVDPGSLILVVGGDGLVDELGNL